MKSMIKMGIEDKLNIAELNSHLKKNCPSFKGINKNGESVYIVLKNGENVSDLFKLYASLRIYGIDPSLKVDTKSGIKKRFVVIKKKEGKPLDPKNYNYRTNETPYDKAIIVEADELYNKYHKEELTHEQYSNELFSRADKIMKTCLGSKNISNVMRDIQKEETKIERKEKGK